MPELATVASGSASHSPSKFVIVRHSSSVVSVLLVLSITAACSAPESERRWEAERMAADRLMDDDHNDEAALAFELLRDEAPNQNTVRYATYRLGMIEERRENPEAAVEYYTRLMDNFQIYQGEDELTARGLFRLGLVRYDQLEDFEGALEIWKLVVRYFPDVDGPAHRALDGLLVHYERNELHQAAVHYFAEAFPAVEHTRMGDNLLYWLAYWYRHHLDDRERAMELFLRVREQYYDRSSLRAEAEWEIVWMLHEQGEYGRELALLYEMSCERDEGYFMGPFATPSIEQASYRLGLVYLENLNDPVTAAEEFQGFLDLWIYSLWRDDAAWGLVQAYVAMGDNAATRRVCDAFLEEYGDSRYEDEVREILGGLSGVGP